VLLQLVQFVAQNLNRSLTGFIATLSRAA